MAIPDKGSLTPLPLGRPLMNSHQNLTLICNHTVYGDLPVAGSTLYDDAQMCKMKAHDITPMDVKIQVEDLNLHAKYLAGNAVQDALTDIQNEKQQHSKLHKKTA